MTDADSAGPFKGVNQRNKIVMSTDEVDAFLAERRAMTMSTINGDGSIHSIAMWYGFLEGAVAIESKAKAQKVVNLRRNPNLTMLVEDGDTYDELRGVTLIGKGEVVEDPDRRVHGGLGAVGGHGEEVARRGRLGEAPERDPAPVR